MKNIVLTGYMASGKTTVGKLLSQKLNFSFYDTDEIIEAEQNCKISEIFDKKGESYFRELENDVSKSFLKVTSSVISTGGGFVLNSENVENLRKNSIIFNLNCDDEVIKSRYEAAKKTRPLMMNNTIENVLKKYNDRKPFYNKCDVKINVGINKSLDEIINEIIEKYNELKGK